MSLDQFVQYDFLTNAAAFDGGIATWKEKYRYDAVRPTSAIRFLYGRRPVRGWAGPGRGIVDDLPILWVIVVLRRPRAGQPPVSWLGHVWLVGPWNTFTEFEEACSQSRVIGGVHFPAATVEAQRMCKPHTLFA